MRRACVALTLVLIAALASACGIPSGDRKRAEALESGIEAALKEASRKRVEYETFAASSDFVNYEKYATREKWAENFIAAYQRVGEAKKVFADEIKPILKKDEPAETEKLRQATFKAERQLNEAKASASHPATRRAYIDQARASYPKLIEEAGRHIAGVNAAFRPIELLALSAKSAHQARAADVDKRIGPIKKLFDDAHVSYKLAVGERDKADRKEAADFALLADHAGVVKNAANKLQEDTARLKSQLESLSRSSCKTLTEMKAKYFITIVRYSWDEDSDWPTTHEYTYVPREIQGEVFDYFNGLPATTEKIAELKRGWTGDSMTYHVDQGKWNVLGIVPRENWPSSSDDQAEYHFDLSVKYFHKYVEERDGKITETNWVEVTEDVFEDHVDDLGMSIACKPLGTFADETLVAPAPAGMAYVGNPAYGQWKTDSSGNTFWQWYGQYMFFSHFFGGTGQPYYYRQSEWDHWNRNYRGREGYYGEDKESKRERYGSSGIITGTSQRYTGRINDVHRYTVRHGEPAGRGTTGGHRGGVGGGVGK